MRFLLYLFFIVSTLALLPSWAFAAASWRIRRGTWVWVNPWDYARYAYISRDPLLVVVNGILWAGILSLTSVVNFAISYLKG